MSTRAAIVAQGAMFMLHEFHVKVSGALNGRAFLVC